ncbi:hypothetical protein A5662_17910 [Mycobacteriaceae bacterium 1482268.1]|nr:hypothetical protein A5662_17910 [Mycobacteriaceae bacterium 1482268.1]
MLQLAIEEQASSSDSEVMRTNWTSRLARPLGRIFRPVERIPAEFLDRDAERIAHEIELIRIRFPHHA